MRRALVLATALALAIVPHVAFAKKERPGPCRQGDVASVVDRPGTGTATATSGSPCTVEPDRVVVETGYRNETDTGPGGTSKIASYPLTLIRVGIDKRDELVLLPATMAVRAGSAAPAFTPAIGTQDDGIGWKHAFHSRAWYQDAAEIFMTYPTGTGGYTLGEPSFSLSYVGAFGLGPRVFASASAGVYQGPGTTPAGATQRYASLQPSLTVGYVIDDRTFVYANENWSFPNGPQDASGNVLLVALAHSITPRAVVDVETTYDLIPTPNYRQTSIGFGGAYYF